MLGTKVSTNFDNSSQITRSESSTCDVRFTVLQEVAEAHDLAPVIHHFGDPQQMSVSKYQPCCIISV